MLTQFVAAGYRNVDTRALPLARVNVLIGPNNSGKSNFLKALRVLADTLTSSDDNLASVLAAHGGADVVPRKASSRYLHLGWTLHPSLEYSCDCVIPAADRWSSIEFDQIVSEPPSRMVSSLGARVAVADRATGLMTGLKTEHLAGKSIIRQKSRLAHDPVLEPDRAWWEGATDRIEAYGRGFASYRCADFRPGDIASPQPSVVSTGRLNPFGSDLVHTLRFLETAPDGLDAFKDRLAELIPGLKRVWTADSGGTHRWIMLNRGGEAWTLSQLSDGTVQALVLAYLLFTPARMSTLCIDEPELNLHPAWLKVIGGWLQRGTSCDQVIVGTHSPDLLDTFTDGFRSGDVAVLVFPGDGRPVRRVGPEELDPMFEEGWELGDLYRVGEPALGGWPW